MKRSIWIITLVVLGIVVASPPLLRAHDGHDCDITGAWVGGSPAIPGVYNIPLIVTLSVIPTDPSGKRFTAGGGGPANGDNTLFGLFPDADQNTASAWTIVRSGPGTYQFIATSYFTKSPKPPNFDRGQILYFWTLTGTGECTGPDTLILSGTLKLYSNVDRPDLIVPPLGIYGVHDQDKDDDGFADAGEVPFFSAPWGFTYKRFPLMTP